MTTAKIKKAAVTKAKIKKGAIDNSKLADNAVTGVENCGLGSVTGTGHQHRQRTPSRR